MRKQEEDVLLSTIGKDAVEIIKQIGDKENVSEVKIAEKLELDIQIIRNKLYKIHDLNLVKYTKKKDRKKGGYISYWTFNKKELYYYIEKEKIRKLEKFKQRLENENENTYYICPTGCKRFDFEKAFDINFRCIECGSALTHQDNRKTIGFLKGKIREIEQEVEA